MTQTPFVVAYGVGVDSTALLVGLVQRGIRPDLILYADMPEKTGTKEFIPVMNAYLEEHGFPTVTVVSYTPKNFKHWPPYYSLEENCLTNGTLPSKAFGFGSCSMKWKAAPQHRFLKTWQPAIDAWASGHYKHGGNMSTYIEQAEQFMSKHGLEFRAVLVGNDCPSFCKDAEEDKDMDKLDVYPRRSHIHGKHYRCTISKAGKGHVSFDFWNSYSDEEFNAVRKSPYDYDYKTLDRVLGRKNYSDGSVMMLTRKLPVRTVTAYDLLACITKYDPGTFENFCGDFGYDTDSRRAEETYRAVVKEWQKVQRFFTSEELEQVREIA